MTITRRQALAIPPFLAATSLLSRADAASPPRLLPHRADAARVSIKDVHSWAVRDICHAVDHGEPSRGASPIGFAVARDEALIAACEHELTHGRPVLSDPGAERAIDLVARFILVDAGLDTAEAWSERDWYRFTHVACQWRDGAIWFTRA